MTRGGNRKVANRSETRNPAPSFPLSLHAPPWLLSAPSKLSFICRNRFMRTLKGIPPRALAAMLVMVVAIGCSAEAKKSRLLDRANSYFESGEYDKAKIEYLNVLRADPRNAMAIGRLGTIWFEQGAPLNAAPFLLKARDLTPDDLEARTKL